MCTYFDKVVDGIDVFSVGKQQLWDWCSYNGREFTGWLPEHTSVISYADSLRKGIYLVVELPAAFGRVLKPQLIASYTSLKSAVSLARTYDEYRLLACPYGCEYGCDYEIWHVVDDSDLWNSWDSDASANRIDVIYKLDEKSRSYRYPYYDGIRFEFDYLYRVYVPFYGFVLFKREHSFDTGFFGIDNELIYEWLILDDYDCPATCFDDLVARPERHQWFSEYSLALLDEPFSKISEMHFERLSTLDAPEMLRESMSLRVGGDVGETC